MEPCFRPDSQERTPIPISVRVIKAFERGEIGPDLFRAAYGVVVAKLNGDGLPE
jgi:hypothetical protein